MAMLAIFSVHAIAILRNEEPRWLMNLCRIGTDLFLLLSGCLIYRSVTSTSLTYRQFIARRAWRILPTYIAVICLYIFVLYQLFPTASRLPARVDARVVAIVANLLIVPLALGARPIITVSWTLAYICMFYLLGYPLIRATRHRSIGARVIVWGTVTAVVYLASGRPALIPLGVLASELISLATPPRWVVLLSLGAAARGLPGAFGPDAQLLFAALAAVAFCWWMLPATTVAPGARFLSRISYSFYLTHGLTILAVARMGLPPGPAMLIALFASLAIASVAYSLVEKPLSPFRSPDAPVVLQLELAKPLRHPTPEGLSPDAIRS